MPTSARAADCVSARVPEQAFVAEHHSDSPAVPHEYSRVPVCVSAALRLSFRDSAQTRTISSQSCRQPSRSNEQNANKRTKPNGRTTQQANSQAPTPSDQLALFHRLCAARTHRHGIPSDSVACPVPWYPICQFGFAVKEGVRFPQYPIRPSNPLIAPAAATDGKTHVVPRPLRRIGAQRALYVFHRVSPRCADD